QNNNCGARLIVYGDNIAAREVPTSDGHNLVDEKLAKLEMYHKKIYQELNISFLNKYRHIPYQIRKKTCIFTNRKG
ncbi:hypothetical protein HZS_2282, partial [Henneguya salminicola]